MVEPLIHFAVPFASLSLLGLKPRVALVASIFALLPDVDALLQYHRSWTHSLIVVAALSLVAYALLRNTPYRVIMLASAFALASHIILDLFSGHTPALWPLLKDSIYVFVSLNVHMDSLTFALKGKILFEPSTPGLPQAFALRLFTGEGLMISLILLLPTLLRHLLKRDRR